MTPVFVPVLADVMVKSFALSIVPVSDSMPSALFSMLIFSAADTLCTVISPVPEVLFTTETPPDVLFTAPDINISPPAADTLTFPAAVTEVSDVCVKLPFAAIISMVVPAVILSFIAADVAEVMSTDDSALTAPPIVTLPVESISILFPEIASVELKFPPFEFNTTSLYPCIREVVSGLLFDAIYMLPLEPVFLFITAETAPADETSMLFVLLPMFPDSETRETLPPATRVSVNIFWVISFCAVIEIFPVPPAFSTSVSCTFPSFALLVTLIFPEFAVTFLRVISPVDLLVIEILPSAVLFISPPCVIPSFAARVISPVAVMFLDISRFFELSRFM